MKRLLRRPPTELQSSSKTVTVTSCESEAAPHKDSKAGMVSAVMMSMTNDAEAKKKQGKSLLKEAEGESTTNRAVALGADARAKTGGSGFGTASLG